MLSFSAKSSRWFFKESAAFCMQRLKFVSSGSKQRGHTIGFAVASICLLLPTSMRDQALH
jgi:hypothetical protein